jgi:hypothetical protein
MGIIIALPRKEKKRPLAYAGAWTVKKKNEPSTNVNV